eukprot:gene6970-3255_t
MHVRHRLERQRRLRRALRAEARRTEAQRLNAAAPACCTKQLQCPVADCRSCGK